MAQVQMEGWNDPIVGGGLRPLPTTTTTAQPAGNDGGWTDPVAPMAEGMPDWLDTRTGAPAAVRASVGSSGTAEDALANGRRMLGNTFMPANDLLQQAGYQPRESFAGNYVYHNPDTGRWTLYNPSGLDLGDVASMAREGAIGLGGAVGGVLGGGAGAAAAGVGAVPGAIAGEAAGSAAGGALYDELAKLFGQIDTRTPQGRILDAALNAATGGGGAALGAALGAGARALGRGAAGSVAAPEAAARAESFDVLGIRPTAGMVAGRGTAVLENQLADLPLGGGAVRAAREAASSDASQAGQRIAGMFGEAGNATEAGTALREGAEAWNAARRATAEDLYGALGRAVPGDTLVEAPAGLAALRGPIEQFASNPALGALLVPSSLRQMADALEAANGRLTWNELRQLRSAVGRRLHGGENTLGDASRRQWSEVYNGLTDDLVNNARRISPDAADAFTTANATYASGIRQAEKISGKLLGDASPQAAFNFVVNGKDPAKIALARQVVGKEKWGDFMSGLINHLGSTPDGFSAQAFARGWGNLTKNSAVRDALVGGTEWAEATGAMDHLLRVAERLGRSGADRPTGFFHGVILGHLGLMNGSSGLLGGWAVSRLLTSPRFVRMLAGATNTKPASPSQALQALGGLAAQLDRTRWNDSGEKAAVHAYVVALRRAQADAQAAAQQQRR